MGFLLRAFGAAAAGLCMAVPTSAQLSRPKVSPSISAGVALPHGDVQSYTSDGGTFGAAIDLSVPGIPVTLRAEAGYTYFAFRRTDANEFDGNRRQWNGGLDFVVPVRTPVAMPYLIGGLGLYQTSVRNFCNFAIPDIYGATGPACPGGASNDLGWSAGVGFDLPGTRLGSRIEVRYTQTRPAGGAYSYIPITFAIRF